MDRDNFFNEQQKAYKSDAITEIIDLFKNKVDSAPDSFNLQLRIDLACTLLIIVTREIILSLIDFLEGIEGTMFNRTEFIDNYFGAVRQEIIEKLSTLPTPKEKLQ